MYARQAVLTAALTALAASAQAQKWEFGGGGGGSIYRSHSVAGAVANASAGFEDNFAVTGVLGHNKYKYVGGEIRYTYEKNDLKVSAGSASATFSGRSQAIHYDVIVHTAPRTARVRPFLAFGGGVKVYEGTGTEVVAQRLSNVALLTKTRETSPLATVGAGIKFALGKRALFRIEVRDYLTPFPKKVIAPAGAAKIEGWVHNFVPMVGLSVLF